MELYKACRAQRASIFISSGLDPYRTDFKDLPDVAFRGGMKLVEEDEDGVIIGVKGELSPTWVKFVENRRKAYTDQAEMIETGGYSKSPHVNITQNNTQINIGTMSLKELLSCDMVELKRQ